METTPKIPQGDFLCNSSDNSIDLSDEPSSSSDSSDCSSNEHDGTMDTVAKIPQSDLYNSSDSSGGSSDEAEPKPLTTEQRLQYLETKVEQLLNTVQTMKTTIQQKDEVIARKDLEIAVLQSENEELQAKLQGLRGNCSINEPPDVLECSNPKRDKAKHIGSSFLNMLCCCWPKQTQSTM